MATKADSTTEKIEIKKFAEFLNRLPPKVTETVSDIWFHNSTGNYYLLKPVIQLHCPSESCGGTRFFRSTESTCLGDRGDRAELQGAHSRNRGFLLACVLSVSPESWRLMS